QHRSSSNRFAWSRSAANTRAAKQTCVAEELFQQKSTHASSFAYASVSFRRYLHSLRQQLHSNAESHCRRGTRASMTVQVSSFLCGQGCFLVFRRGAMAEKWENVVGVIAPLFLNLLSMIAPWGGCRAVALPAAAIADDLDDDDRRMVVVGAPR